MAGFATADGAKDATTQVAHVLGSGHKKPMNLELWARYALLNEPDWRGEAMVHALLRGLEAGEESARGAFLAWALSSFVTSASLGRGLGHSWQGFSHSQDTHPF